MATKLTVAVYTPLSATDNLGSGAELVSYKDYKLLAERLQMLEEANTKLLEEWPGGLEEIEACWTNWKKRYEEAQEQYNRSGKTNTYEGMNLHGWWLTALTRSGLLLRARRYLMTMNNFAAQELATAIDKELGI